MIKTKAANVSRLEVAAALRGLPGVELPVVARLPDPELGELVVAAIVAVPGAEPSEDALRAGLQGVLSSHKIPRRIVFISSDPVQSTANRQHNDLNRALSGKRVSVRGELSE